MTANRECDSSRVGVKGITEVCQLMGRCDGPWGAVRSLG